MKHWKVVVSVVVVLSTVIVGSLILSRTDSDTIRKESLDHGHNHGEGQHHEHGQAEDGVHEHAESEHTTSGEHERAESGHAHDDGHAHEEGEHVDEGIVHMTEAQMERFGIEVEKVRPGIFEVRKTVQGELVMNTDRTAHIVPRVSGVVSEVRSRLGDRVKKGDVLAVIESGDLADVKAAYLASIERLALADAVHGREEKLWKDKISSESEYLDAKKDLAEAKIEKRSAEQKLHSLGFSRTDLEKLRSESAERFTVFEITAPLDGTIVQKHITVGEAVKDDADIFMIVDLDTVWADLSIYKSDIGSLMIGQEVIITARSDMPATRGVISYVDPVIDPRNRTALARVVLDNTSGQLRPGTFVTAEIITDKPTGELVVDRSGLQEVDDQSCVFVWDGHCFRMRRVTVGRSNGQYAEIVAGLRPGEMIATTNSFRLKAELEKSVDNSCAGHGHAL
jgi:cobalt-zinc-cadmium efflux system membrane fusion protein